MAAAFISVEVSYSKGMARVAENSQPWDPGACRRR